MHRRTPEIETSPEGRTVTFMWVPFRFHLLQRVSQRVEIQWYMSFEFYAISPSDQQLQRWQPRQSLKTSKFPLKCRLRRAIGIEDGAMS